MFILIGDDEVFTTPQEEWFEILLEKYQLEYGTHQHEHHDGDLILSVLQDKSLLSSCFTEKLPESSSAANSTDETEISEGKSDRSLSMMSLSTVSSITIPKKVLRKCRPPLNLFSAYYACCLLGEIDCTEKEWRALMKVF